MRRVSKKRQALMRQAGPARKAFVESKATVCMVCHTAGHALQCHEIARGAAREKCLTEPSLWLAVCSECHEELGDYEKWPLARQLAARLWWDLCESVFRFNEIRGRAQSAVTPQSVARVLHSLGEP